MEPRTMASKPACLVHTQRNPSVPILAADTHADYNQTLCTRCQKINFRKLFGLDRADRRDRYHVAHSSGWLDVMSVVQNRTQRCIFCRLLVFVFYHGGKRNRLLSFPKGRISFYRETKWHDGELEQLAVVWNDALGSSKAEGCKYNITISTNSSEADRKTRTGRAINHSQVDFELIGKWISCCDRHHINVEASSSVPEGFNEACSIREGEVNERLNIRLIDVHLGRIVWAPHPCKYAALSYVWGSGVQQKLNSDNEGRLTSNGALFDEATRPSKSISDAILLCKELGIHYLWVDALCILQDNDADKKEQIGMMGLIYGSAFLTIVAAAGSHANAGLPGVRPNTRKAFQVSVSIHGIQLITTVRSPLEDLKLSKWSSRGWTLQEQALSRRVLVFTDELVFMRCPKAIFREDIIVEDPRGGVLEEEGQIDGIILGIQDHLEESRRQKVEKEIWGEDLFESCGFWGRTVNAWQIYRTLTADLATREFTYPKDVLDAFSGISKILEPTLGELWWGLPILEFVNSWCWHTDGKCSRRGENGFPSWSWAGWLHGRTDTLAFSKPSLPSIPAEDHYRFNCAQQLVRITDGNIIDEPKLQTLASLNNVSSIDTLLVIWGSVLALPVDKDVDRKSKTPGTYIIRDSKRHIVARIVLDPEWRQKQSRRLTFLELAREAQGTMVRTMLIRWDGNEALGVAYRVHTSTQHLDAAYWDAANPQRRLLCLG
ncbi:heterokaryon incompatibility protein-domain-containing protein [Rhexocercosporidium sp. MPI-PUGE-AT-0058]|nr:heterokaryon incompatibility protein-domain-containing protein [Rhexocercosporidium sp. MPI-PUGE-AT-0058]